MAGNNNDILLDGLDGDLLIVNGDLVIGDSTIQNTHDIIEYTQGSIKQFPNCGVGIITYQNGSINGLSNKINKQLTTDGLTVNQLNISFDANGELQIKVATQRL